MNKEKQIEEMAIELSKVNCKPKGCGYCYLEYGTLENSCEEYLVYKKMAIDLYEKGYRKASDIVSELSRESRETLNRASGLLKGSTVSENLTKAEIDLIIAVAEMIDRVLQKESME